MEILCVVILFIAMVIGWGETWKKKERYKRYISKFYPCSGSLSTLILLSLTLQNRVVLYKIARKCVKNDTFTQNNCVNACTILNNALSLQQKIKH